MTVEIKYIVKRKGIEVMSSANQKEANAYDKMLDISDELREFLEKDLNNILGEKLSENDLEDLCILLAEKKDLLSKILRGQKVEKETLKNDKSDKVDTPVVKKKVAKK